MRNGRGTLSLATVAFGLLAVGWSELVPDAGFAQRVGAHAYTETVVHRFAGSPLDGSAPSATLLVDSNGALYGSTQLGGSSAECVTGEIAGCGIVFKLTTLGSSYDEDVLYSFPGGNAGAFPLGSLVDLAGTLFSTTFLGGLGSPICKYPRNPGCGTVFNISRSGRRGTFIYKFAGAQDGGAPEAGLYVDAAGTLFGTSSGYGGYGTAFKMVRHGSLYVEKVLHRFRGGVDGLEPRGALIADAHGDLFGTTRSGGNPSSGGGGVVFELAPSHAGYSERILHAFGPQGGDDGATPFAGLVFDRDGSLYGTTSFGGGYGCGGAGCGTVFTLTPSGSTYIEAVIHRFHGALDGANPKASLIADANGTLYGTTISGGGRGRCQTFGCGTVFSLTHSGSTYTEHVLYRFQGKTDGANPFSGLAIDHSGALYGTTEFGGGTACAGSGCGTVFKLTP